MPRKPNYRFERQERERLKAAKKAAKKEAKAAEKEAGTLGADGEADRPAVAEENADA